MEEIMSPDHWVALVANSAEYQNPEIDMAWSYFKTGQHTPFVDTGLTRRDMENFPGTTAGVSPKYNLYIPGYEASIASPDLPETSIPNGYTYYLVNDSKVDISDPTARVPTHIVAPQLGDDDPWPGVRPDLINSQNIVRTGRRSTTANENLLTLGGELSPDLIYKNAVYVPNHGWIRGPSSVSVQKYYREYSKIIGSTEDVSTTTEDIIFPSTDRALLDNMEDNSRMFPMDIDIKFRKDSFSNASAQILENNLCSVRILSGIPASKPIPQPCSLTSDGLAPFYEYLVATRQPPINKNINFYDLSEAHSAPVWLFHRPIRQEAPLCCLLGNALLRQDFLSNRC
jgi:hypothetical protein